MPQNLSWGELITSFYCHSSAAVTCFLSTSWNAAKSVLTRVFFVVHIFPPHSMSLPLTCPHAVTCCQFGWTLYAGVLHPQFPNWLPHSAQTGLPTLDTQQGTYSWNVSPVVCVCTAVDGNSGLGHCLCTGILDSLRATEIPLGWGESLKVSWWEGEKEGGTPQCCGFEVYCSTLDTLLD